LSSASQKKDKITLYRFTVGRAVKRRTMVIPTVIIEPLGCKKSPITMDIIANTSTIDRLTFYFFVFFSKGSIYVTIPHIKAYRSHRFLFASFSFFIPKLSL